MPVATARQQGHALPEERLRPLRPCNLMTRHSAVESQVDAVAQADQEFAWSSLALQRGTLAETSSRPWIAICRVRPAVPRRLGPGVVGQGTRVPACPGWRAPQSFSDFSAKRRWRQPGGWLMPGRLAERVPLRRHALFSGILCHMPCEKLAGLQPHGLLLPRSPVPRPSAWSLGCSRGKARRMPAPQGRFASSRSCRQASRRCQGSLAVSVEADLAAFPARVPQEEAAKPIPQTDAWCLHRAGRQQAWRAGAACMFRRSASFLRHMSVRLAEALRAWPRAVRAGLLQGGAAGSNPAGSPGLAGRARS